MVCSTMVRDLSFLLSFIFNKAFHFPYLLYIMLVYVVKYPSEQRSLFELQRHEQIYMEANDLFVQVPR